MIKIEYKIISNMSYTMYFLASTKSIYIVDVYYCETNLSSTTVIPGVSFFKICTSVVALYYTYCYSITHLPMPRLNYILFSCFGKITHSNSNIRIRKLLLLNMAKFKTICISYSTNTSFYFI